MSVYPIILIPEAIESARSSQPPFPVPKPQPPNEPISPQPPVAPLKPVDEGSLWTFGVIGLIIVLLILAANLGLGFLALIGFIGFLSFIVEYNRNLSRQTVLYLKQVEEYQKQQLHYQDELEAMPARKAEYQKALEQYEAKRSEYYKSEQMEQLKLEQVVKILKQTYSYDGNQSKAKEGRSETRLALHLIPYFPVKILRKLTLTIPGCEHPYSPDIAYVDPATGLHIDIEIDEPYAYKTKDPIHCIGVDDQRNTFFLERGWIVIRFSEEQVVKYPEECCKTVAQVIRDLIGKTAISPEKWAKLEQIPALKPMPQWTHEEAMEMAQKNYRHTYLGKWYPLLDGKLNQGNHSGILRSIWPSSADLPTGSNIFRHAKKKDEIIKILQSIRERSASNRLSQPSIQKSLKSIHAQSKPNRLSQPSIPKSPERICPDCGTRLPRQVLNLICRCQKKKKAS